MRVSWRVTSLLSLGLFVVCASAAPNADDWPQVARSDLRFVRDSLQANHPGAVDPGNPAFSRWLAEGFATADALAGRARDYAGYFFAIQYYTNGFQDGHVYALRRDDRLSYRWPGFILALRDEDFVIHPGGDRLIACDGRPAVEMAQETLGTYVGLWSVRGARSRLAPHLLVDEGNPFAPLARSCVFESETGRREIALEWRPIAWKALTRQIDRARGSPQPSIGLRKIRGGYWVSLSSFKLGDPEISAAYGRLVHRLGEHAHSLRNASLLVFDVRGNTGGSSTVGVEVLSALLGESAARSLLPLPVPVDWRVSRGNLAHVRDVTLRLVNREYGEDSPEATQYRRIVRGLQGALDSGDIYYREIDDVTTASAGVSALPAAKLRPRVFLLTDGACASACLDFADMMLAWPAVVHVGAETRADTAYMEVRAEPLPSGLGSVGIAMKVYRGRKRGHNETYVPQHLWRGSMDDTPALEAWIATLAGIMPETESPSH